jgi:hypothetical protein
VDRRPTGCRQSPKGWLASIWSEQFLPGAADPTSASAPTGHTTATLGLGLEDGKAILAAVQRHLVATQAEEIISGLQRAAGIVLDHLFGSSLWRRIHQAVARYCHWQRHRREVRA